MLRYRENCLNVDADLASSFMEDEIAMKPEKQEDKEADWQKWINMFNKNSEEKSDEDIQNSYSKNNLGETENKEKEPQKNFFDKAGDWIKENPMTALIGTILIGSAGYLLYKHLTKITTGETRSEASGRRSRKPKRKEDIAEKKEASEFSLSREEIVTGVAATAGGALLGTIMNEHIPLAVFASLGVVGAINNNVSLLVTAIGLAFGGLLKNVFEIFSEYSSKGIIGSIYKAAAKAINQRDKHR